MRTNITPVALKQLQVNALMIVDLQGDVVLVERRGSRTGAPLDLDFAARKSVARGLPWRRNLAERKVRAGPGVARTEGS